MNYRTKTLNYKYHIIWLCSRITSFATLLRFLHISWCSHKMDTFSALLAICAGNSPVTGKFPMQRPVTRNFDVFFDLCLSKQWWGWWFEMPLCPSWCHWCSDKPLTGLALNLVGEPIRVGVGGHFLLNSYHFLASVWLSSFHGLQLNSWWDWPQTWWVKSLRNSSDLSDAPLNSCCLFASSWSVYVHFSTYSWPDWPQTCWMNLIRGIPRPDKTFVRAPLNSCCFLASDWSSPYGIPQAWLTLMHVSLNSIILEFDWFSFHAFTYKPLDGLTSNLVDELIIGLPRPDKLLVPLC